MAISLVPATSRRLLMKLPKLFVPPERPEAAYAAGLGPEERAVHIGAGANLAVADDFTPVVDAASATVRSAQGAEAPHALSRAPEHGVRLPRGKLGEAGYLHPAR